VTNTGSSVIGGDVGVAAGTAITGFPPGIVTPPGTIDADDAAAIQAQLDLTTAYNFAASTVDEPCGTTLSGDLGGLTLTPGVYCFTSGEPSAALTGMLTLNNGGNANAVFVFQILSTLTTGSNSSVVTTNGQDDSIFWQVGSSATLGTGTAFEGNILALTSIALTTGATIECGSALARNGAVTLDDNVVSVCPAASSVPEPSTGSLLILIGAPCLMWLRKLKSVRG
jgi:type VI secretion system secreted protein VgrG